MSSLLWLPASSPLFSYSPSSAYFSGSTYTSPWLGTTDSSLSAPNNTYKATNGPSAFILPTIFAVSFTPVWDQTTFEIGLAVDSGQPTSWTSGENYTAQGQGQGQAQAQGVIAQHSFQVDVQCSTTDCSSSPFQFHGAWVGTEFAPPDGSNMQSVTLDDASPYVLYSGFSAVPSSPGGSSPSSPITVDKSDNNGTLSVTTTSGASASVSFQGTSVLVYGVTASSLGIFTISIDGTIAATLSAQDNVTTHGNVLFYATDLDTTKPHTLELTCKDGGLVLDNWVAYGPQGGVGFIGSAAGGSTTIGPSASPSGSGTSTGPTSTTTGGPNGATGSGSPNAGAIVGGIIGALAGLGLLFFFFRRVAPRLKNKERHLNAWDQANLLQNMKNEGVHVTTAANQRYVYPGLIAHSQLKK
ncbi:MAG: hypothetical protein TREMPRED_000238 [Tremellales sp. Tagirdzhanova-0007]|nr:MAG: hypothetical protein TREMPRED_000238 [Tremellales sp. Tagirdzhanova-0007]